MSKEALIRGLALVACLLLDLLTIVQAISFSNKAAYVIFIACLFIANVICVGVAYYYNNDISDSSKVSTHLMRRVKRLIAKGDASVYDKLDHMINELEEEYREV